MELVKAILTRRSVRKFTDEKVSGDAIREILEAARFAQSWANTQVWEFIVVRDRSLIESVVSTFSDSNPARKGALVAPALIVACARLKVSGCRDGVERTRFNEWFMFDMGIAVQNMCLRAHDLGLGTVVVGSMDHQACEKIIQVPDGHAVVAVIPVGIPVERDKPAPARKELVSFVHCDTFGNLWDGK